MERSMSDTSSSSPKAGAQPQSLLALVSSNLTGQLSAAKNKQGQFSFILVYYQSNQWFKNKKIPYQWSGGQCRDCRWPWGEGDACGFLGPPLQGWSSWQLCCRCAVTAGTLEPAWTLPWHGGSQRYASWEDGCRVAGSTHGDPCWEHHGRSELRSLWRQKSGALSPWHPTDWSTFAQHTQVIPVVPPPGGVLTDITPG